MKSFVLISIFSLLMHSTLSQCAKDGLNIQSDACEAPKNLSVLTVNCTVLKLQWQGKPGQDYQVKTSLADSFAAGNIEVKTIRVTANDSGRCEAAVPVKGGYRLNWLVQAVCSSGEADFYSIEIMGRDTVIPACVKGEMPLSHIISVYPNPSKNNLFVEYKSIAAGPITFNIYNISGNKIFSKTEKAAANTKMSYSLDISRLQPGTYLLKTSSEKDGSSEAKFVKINL